MALPLIPIAFGVSALASAVTRSRKAGMPKELQHGTRVEPKPPSSNYADTASALMLVEKNLRPIEWTGHAAAADREQKHREVCQLMNQIAGSDFGEIRSMAATCPLRSSLKSELENASHQTTDFLQHGVQVLAAGAMVGAGWGKQSVCWGMASTGTARSPFRCRCNQCNALHKARWWISCIWRAGHGWRHCSARQRHGWPSYAIGDGLFSSRQIRRSANQSTHSAEIDKAVEQFASMSVALDAIDTRTQELCPGIANTG